MRIRLNRLAFDLLMGEYWDSDAYKKEDFEDFKDIFPEGEIDGSEKADIIADYLDENITILDTITYDLDLEKGYESCTLILKYNDKLYGFDYCYSAWYGYELSKFGEYVDELPEYEETTKVTYILKQYEEI